MNNKRAKELSKIVNNEELKKMLSDVINDKKIKWDKPSKANKGLSKGTHWNIFCSELDFSNGELSEILKYRLLQEYGDYLEGYDQEVKSIKKINCTHQEPKFDFFKKNNN